MTGIVLSKQMEIVTKALENVSEDYYKIQTAGSSSKTTRERVFCYELYHQIRLLSDETEMKLHAEIDKRGHSCFSEEDRKNPDFIFHMPGTFKKNMLVIEVKGTTNEAQAICEDFKKLIMFVDRYRYREGLFILFNKSMEELIKSIVGKCDEQIPCHSLGTGSLNRIMVICKKNAEAELQMERLGDVLSGVSNLH